MRSEYNPSEVETRWQKKWNEAKAYEVDLKKAKDPFYNLVMFPYPSGDKLHVGHWYNFAPADSFGRYMRMKGKDVFEPMGFDAFGLPAENYAIKTGTPPAESISKNVETMINQLSRIGTMYDWSKTVNTSTPDYYRWTQWLFLQMHKHDLAYRKEGNVNWCPKDQTVLANEQVKDGQCERCGTEVIQKPLTQWYWKITDYAQHLLDGLNTLDWPEKTKLMQQHWIGRSEGTEVMFDIEHHEDHAPWEDETTLPNVTVFTTRVDTIFSAAFLVLAPEHPYVEKIVTKKHRGEVDRYIADTKRKTEMQRTDLAKEKTGVFTGAYAINPVNEERIPIWIGDFVLAHYGKGAVFGDAHDERDFVFAKKYDIPLKTTIVPADNENSDAIRALEVCFSGDGILENSDAFTGLTSAEARKRITSWLEDAEKGRGIINYRLRDWLVSRQRYWGAPIPIVYDPEGNPHPIPEKHLPWLLPTDVEFKPTGKSPLTESKEFIERTEKIFGKGWTPEFDTMDTFVCSSFYYLRYLACHPEPDEGRHADEVMVRRAHHDTLIDPTIEKRWMPVSMYIGGPEHATMHLIYARFVMMALKDFGFVSHEEPFQRLVHQGLITNQGAKMSKSKGNVVSPDSFVDEYGSDVFRMYLMFMGPFTDGGDWSDTGIKGIARFVQRVWRLISEKSDAKTKDNRDVLMKLHRTIKSVTDGLETLHFNTAIASLMELLNTLESRENISTETAQTFAKLLSPIAPHLAEELWDVLKDKNVSLRAPRQHSGQAPSRSDTPDFIIDQPWPLFDSAHLQSDTLMIVVQVNGKLRGNITVDAKASKEDILAEAKKDPNVAKYIEGGIKKEIYVPGKLVSFVV